MSLVSFTGRPTERALYCFPRGRPCPMADNALDGCTNPTIYPCFTKFKGRMMAGLEVPVEEVPYSGRVSTHLLMLYHWLGLVKVCLSLHLYT